MKKFIKFLALTLIAVIIQNGIFLFIEKVYCSTDITTKAEKVEMDDPSANLKNEIQLKDGVEGVKVSTDGRFIAYAEDGKLKVYDISDESEKEFENIYSKNDSSSSDDSDKVSDKDKTNTESSASDKTDKSKTSTSSKSTTSKEKVKETEQKIEEKKEEEKEKNQEIINEEKKNEETQSGSPVQSDSSNTNESISKENSPLKENSKIGFDEDIENVKLYASSSDNDNSTIDAQIVYYKWLPNESNMIIVRKIKENGSYYFEPISFDAKKGVSRELTDFNLNKIRIQCQSNDDTVDDVQFSTSTSSLYIKIKKSTGRSNLYYLNIMNELKRVKSNIEIGNIAVPTTGVNAVIETGSQINVINTNDSVKVPNVTSPKILGNDFNDNIYFGKEENGKIQEIYYADFSKDSLSWQKMVLKTPIDRNDIIVEYSTGSIYCNSKTEKVVTELKSNKQLSYNGEVIQGYKNGFITLDGNVLLKNEMK
ncbi:hypothetical protein [Clostridium sp. BJN0001]|uniref:hypothetical protein n=1 Tax=Clostridium sp. BJN0001 TaxID=2930219 RepID=UPI001FCFDC91|nr:hypothetical protein [Clostridium sp. BJN0001]